MTGSQASKAETEINQNTPSLSVNAGHSTESLKMILRKHTWDCWNTDDINVQIQDSESYDTTVYVPNFVAPRNTVNLPMGIHNNLMLQNMNEDFQSSVIEKQGPSYETESSEVVKMGELTRVTQNKESTAFMNSFVEDQFETLDGQSYVKEGNDNRADMNESPLLNQTSTEDLQRQTSIPLTVDIIRQTVTPTTVIKRVTPGSKNQRRGLTPAIHNFDFQHKL